MRDLFFPTALFVLFAYTVWLGVRSIVSVAELMAELDDLEESDSSDADSLSRSFRALRVCGWATVFIGLAGCALAVAVGAG